MPVLFDSPNTRPEADRVRTIALLATATANVKALQSAAETAHWNVRGAMFFVLHPIFGQLRDDLGDYADALAERAATLGGLALGTVEQIGKTTTVAPYPTTISDGADHVRELYARVKALLVELHALRAEASTSGNADTYDLLTGDVIRPLEKWGWQLAAAQQSPSGTGAPTPATPTPPPAGTQGAAEGSGG